MAVPFFEATLEVAEGVEIPGRRREQNSVAFYFAVAEFDCDI